MEKLSTTVPLGTATCAFIQVRLNWQILLISNLTPPCLRRKAIPVPLLWSQIPNELQQARAREEMPGPARPCHPHTLDAGEPERGAERRLQITPAGNNNNNNQCSSKPSPTTQPKKALPGKNPVNQTSEEAATPPYSYPGRSILSGCAAKIKIVSRPNTRLVISYVATIYLTPQSRYGEAKSRKQETAILIFFRGLQKVTASKLAPVFGTKRISSRNIF